MNPSKYKVDTEVGRRDSHKEERDTVLCLEEFRLAEETEWEQISR